MKDFFKTLAVPEEDLEALQKHLVQSKSYIAQEDGGISAAVDWILSCMQGKVDVQTVNFLMLCVNTNLPQKVSSYDERGYDSHQSHRQVAKIVGEIFLIAGLMYESKLLGLRMDVSEAQILMNSTLNLPSATDDFYISIAEQYGANQDFLFPGVVPSPNSTELTLEELAYLSLVGRPKPNVRNLTGLGGLRDDKEWNHTTDINTFTDLKVTEDKRYYPGLGLMYLLTHMDIEVIPLFTKLKKENRDDYDILVSLIELIKNSNIKDYEGVSILCSAYIPPWEETKHCLNTLNGDHLVLSDAFHSPAYEYSVLKKLIMQVANKMLLTDTELMMIEHLKKSSSHIWSFNSTIHLPWTSDRAYLSNELMGKVGNLNGDACIRYGAGYKGRSLEIREYHLGRNRKYPLETAGATGYLLFYYSSSDCFSGQYEEINLTPHNPWWKEIEKYGFMRVALEFLKERNEENK